MKIIKVPLSSGSLGKAKGTAKAPEKVAEYSDRFYSSKEGAEEKPDVESIGIDNANIEESHKRIYEKAEKIFSDNNKIIFLGGDHSITYSAFKAFAKTHDNPGIIIFDAHPDLMQSFYPTTHENWLRNLIEEGILKKNNAVLVGSRNIDREEYSFIKKMDIKTFPLELIESEGIMEFTDSIMESARRFSSLYVSIDIDILDPAFAPGTGYPEPGGLTTRELLFILKRMTKMTNLKAADIVEIDPEKDNQTAIVGAKILKELNF